MKSKNNNTIIATKRINFGIIPMFIQFGHKGLEKSQPDPIYTVIKGSVDEKTYNIPRDILQITVSDPTLYEDIESIEFTYSKAPLEEVK